MYRKLCYGVAVAAMLFFSACGDDGPSTGTEKGYDWESLGDVVRGVCNLKPCDANSEGDSVYVVSEKQNYYCSRGAWKDSAGEAFSDAQFIACYMENVIQDSLSSRDKLGACTDATEGQLFTVNGGLIGCTAGKWVDVSDAVVTGYDMQGCKSGKYYFVLNTQAVSKCEASAGSSSGTANSSSSGTGDGAKVRGVCMPSVKQVERGDSVTYSFYNMGGAPQTFSWDFGDVADIESSSERTPTVTYLSNGYFRVGLIVNKGMQSESDSILCPVVRATGKLISGCECTVDKSLTRITREEPDSAVWTVSGCVGGEDLRYRWKDCSPISYLVVDKNLNVLQDTDLDSAWIVSEDGMSVKLVLDSVQKVAPRLTVTNETDEYMDVQCPAVSAVKKERVYAQCSMEFAGDTGYTFVVQSVSGADYLSELPMVLSSDHGYSEDVRAKCSIKRVSSDTDEGRCVSWGRTMLYNAPASFAVPIPAEPGIHTYTLTFEGEEVCSARMPVTCAPHKGRVYMNDSVTWNVNGLNGFEPTTYEWTFYKGNIDDDVSIESTPGKVYAESGTYSARLVLDAGLETEMSISCKDVIVNRHDITGCTCGKPELVSESDDITQTDAVTFRWNVSDCRSAIPLTYTWAEGYTAAESDPSQATASFTASGYYVPEVFVTNEDGSGIFLTCKLATVRGADSQTLTYGGQTYNVVEIQGRTWMAENLNYETEYSRCFMDLEENCAKYGRLYTYEDAVRVCPEGWHLPGIDEFLEVYDMVNELETYGFEPLPAGMYSSGSGQYISDEMSWWFDYLIDGADYAILLVIGDGGFPYRDEYVENAHSVRCVKD